MSRGSRLRAALMPGAPPRRLALVVVGAAVAIALLATLVPVYWLFLCAWAAVSAVVLLGLGVVTGGAGMISLCQLSFAAVGAWVVCWLSAHDVPGGLLLWVVLGALAAVPFGVLVGLPALRLRGVHLAVVTLGFALAMDVVLVAVGFPGGADFLPVARPALFLSDRAYFVLASAVFTIVALVVSAVGRGRVGASWQAVRFSERAAAATGASVPQVKLSAFAVGAFLAGLGGGLLAGLVGLVVAQSFDALHSLVFYVLAVISGAWWWDGALTGGVLGVFVPELFRRLGVSADWANVLFGLAATQALAGGLTGAERARRALRRRRASRAATAAPVPAELATVEADAASAGEAASHRPAAGGAVLRARDLSVSYGEVTALNRVSLDLAGGMVTGLIGPNGAGKSTLVDALTGFVAAGGAVRLAGRPLTDLAPHQRAVAGLRRTFQQDRVPPSLTVGQYLRYASHRRVAAAEVERTAARFGCPPADTLVRECDVAARRVLEVVAGVLAQPALLVLDEPAAGMARHEALALAERIALVPRRLGAAVLVIEHNLEFVRHACERLVVLNFGEVIADGDPHEVLASAAVTQAYLGDEAVVG